MAAAGGGGGGGGSRLGPSSWATSVKRLDNLLFVGSKEVILPSQKSGRSAREEHMFFGRASGIGAVFVGRAHLRGERGICAGILERWAGLDAFGPNCGRHAGFNMCARAGNAG